MRKNNVIAFSNSAKKVRARTKVHKRTKKMSNELFTGNDLETVEFLKEIYKMGAVVENSSTGDLVGVLNSIISKIESAPDNIRNNLTALYNHFTNMREWILLGSNMDMLAQIPISKQYFDEETGEFNISESIKLILKVRENVIKFKKQTNNTKIIDPKLIFSKDIAHVDYMTYLKTMLKIFIAFDNVTITSNSINFINIIVAKLISIHPDIITLINTVEELELTGDNIFEHSISHTHTKKTLVVAGFPGVGKTYLTKQYDEKEEIVLDSDSSLFDKKDFPNNYIEHIKSVIGKADVVFVSTHADVLAKLKEENVDFKIICPKKELKEEYLSKYKERGNDDAFIKLLSENWDMWISDIGDKYGDITLFLNSGETLMEHVHI